MQNDLKIVVVGPSRSGKTEICNLLSAVQKDFSGNCKPTIGIRILEFSTTVDFSGYQGNINVQLWDVSGDEKYGASWSAIAHNADGIMVIYNANEISQGKQVENYIKNFAAKIDPTLCFVVAHRIGEIEGKPVKPRLPKAFENVQLVMTDVRESMDKLLAGFNEFLSRVQNEKVKRIEEQERQLIGDYGTKKKGKNKNDDEQEEE